VSFASGISAIYAAARCCQASFHGAGESLIQRRFFRRLFARWGERTAQIERIKK
jgi:hypothetical protein